jgi:hypothetical protein
MNGIPLKSSEICIHHDACKELLSTFEYRSLSCRMPSIWDAAPNVAEIQYQASEDHEWKTAVHPVSRKDLLRWHNHSCNQ